MVVGENDGWLEQESRSDWLREEYRLLSEHYFHEDNFILKMVTFYATLSGGLLAFLASTVVGNNTALNRLVAVIGIAVSLSWLISVVRQRELRQYLSNRMRRIEKELHSVWPSADFQPLDIKTLAQWDATDHRHRWYNAPYFAIRRIPASLVLALLPAAFTVGWIVLLLGNWL
ncbi:MAG: hypothetical protein GY720_06960 [bacterium]|nr:hypothetical protein [bacterium]